MNPGLPLIGPADPVNEKFNRLLGSVIGFGLSLVAATLWCALPTLCRLASATVEALL